MTIIAFTFEKLLIASGIRWFEPRFKYLFMKKCEKRARPIVGKSWGCWMIHVQYYNLDIYCKDAFNWMAARNNYFYVLIVFYLSTQSMCTIFDGVMKRKARNKLRVQLPTRRLLWHESFVIHFLWIILTPTAELSFQRDQLCPDGLVGCAMEKENQRAQNAIDDGAYRVQHQILVVLRQGAE